MPTRNKRHLVGLTKEKNGILLVFYEGFVLFAYLNGVGMGRLQGYDIVLGPVHRSRVKNYLHDHWLSLLYSTFNESKKLCDSNFP